MQGGSHRRNKNAFLSTPKMNSLDYFVFPGVVMSILLMLIGSFNRFFYSWTTKMPMNASIHANVFSPKPSTDRFHMISSLTLLATWGTVFSIEAALVILVNIASIIFLIRGQFDRVRYFAVSLAFIEVIRGCVATVIVIGLVQTNGHSCTLNYQELHLAFQTLCDVFSLCFLAAISCDVYYRIFWPLTHRRARARCYMTANFVIWILSMTATMFFACALRGYFQLLIANVVLWFVEIVDVTVICTNYVLVWREIRSGEYDYVWMIKKRNFTFAKAFSFCAVAYLAIWMPVEVAEGICHFTQSCEVYCNVQLLIKFLKIMCSTFSPLIYLRTLCQFHKSCTLCTIIWNERSLYLPDSLPLITLRSASYLMTGFD